MAYFNIYKVYSSIDINFNMENCISKKLKVYLKFQVYERKEEFNDMEISLNDTEIDEFSIAYESPNIYNYDYKAKINNFMCSANINIPDLPEYEELFLGKKVIRVLLGFYIYQDENLISTPMDDDEEEDYDFDYNDEYDYLKNMEILIHMLYLSLIEEKVVINQQECLQLYKRNRIKLLNNFYF